MPSAPRRALIVVDVQNEYFTGNLPIEYPPTDRSLPAIARAMVAAREASIPVVVVQHTAPAGAPIFDRGSPGGQLHPEIARRPSDHRVEKSQASVFAGTDLAAWLAGQRVETVTLVGYMTHNCDAASVFEASHAGLQVEVLADATGALPYANRAGRATAEEIHRTFQVVFQSNFAAVLSTDEWLAALATGSPPERDSVLASSRRARLG